MRLILVHGHIFKNAGTTLDWSLRRSFGAGFIDHRDDDAMRADGTRELARLAQDNPTLVAVSSHHMASTMPDVPGCRFKPVYLLRHPIERIRSVYEFERVQDASSPGAIAAKEKNFRDYVAWRMQPDVRPVIRNYQTAYLSGQHVRSGNLAGQEIDLPRACEQLQAHSITGTVERYDETVVVIEHQLGQFLPGLDLAYLRQNVTRRDETDSQADAGLDIRERLGDLLDQVVHENRYDLELHELANHHLDQVIAGIPGFSQRLAHFQRRCAALALEA